MGIALPRAWPSIPTAFGQRGGGTLARRHHCGCAPRWRRLAAVAPVASTERHGRRDRVQSSLRLSGSRRRCLPAALLPVQGPSPPVSHWSTGVPWARDDECRIRGTPSTDAGAWRRGEGLASRPCVFGPLLCFFLLSPGGSSTQQGKTPCYSGATWVGIHTAPQSPSDDLDCH